jgi:hypothetical protein
VILTRLAVLVKAKMEIFLKLVKIHLLGKHFEGRKTLSLTDVLDSRQASSTKRHALKAHLAGLSERGARIRNRALKKLMSGMMRTQSHGVHGENA